MAHTNISLQQKTHHSNTTLNSLFHALDPISLILSQKSSQSENPVPLKLTTTESFIMERGPRYEAYAELREKKLRMKYTKQQQQQQQQQQEFEEIEPKIATPQRKKVNFQGDLGSSGRKGFSSVLAQSVPDFSAALRKENRKPLNTLPTVTERTLTPPSKSSWNNGVLSNSKGSKSASAGEKKKKMGDGSVLMARKSYASIDELKSLSKTTANAINGEGNRGGRNNSRVMGRTFSGFRQF